MQRYNRIINAKLTVKKLLNNIADEIIVALINMLLWAVFIDGSCHRIYMLMFWAEARLYHSKAINFLEYSTVLTELFPILSLVGMATSSVVGLFL